MSIREKRTAYQRPKQQNDYPLKKDEQPQAILWPLK